MQLLPAPATGCVPRCAGLAARIKRDQAALDELNAWTATLSAEERAAFDVASDTDVPPAGAPCHPRYLARACPGAKAIGCT
jgi:hypothetical protein